MGVKLGLSLLSVEHRLFE